jgi:hypothetical protein
MMDKIAQKVIDKYQSSSLRGPESSEGTAAGPPAGWGETKDCRTTEERSENARTVPEQSGRSNRQQDV